MQSGPVNTSKTLPKGKILRGVKFSWIHKMSFFFIRFSARFHLVRFIKVAAYILSNHFQKLSSRSFVIFQDLLLHLFVLSCA